MKNVTHADILEVVTNLAIATVEAANCQIEHQGLLPLSKEQQYIIFEALVRNGLSAIKTVEMNRKRGASFASIIAMEEDQLQAASRVLMGRVDE